MSPLQLRGLAAMLALLPYLGLLFAVPIFFTPILLGFVSIFFSEKIFLDASTLESPCSRFAVFRTWLSASSRVSAIRVKLAIRMIALMTRLSCTFCRQFVFVLFPGFVLLA